MKVPAKMSRSGIFKAETAWSGISPDIFSLEMSSHMDDKGSKATRGIFPNSPPVRRIKDNPKGRKCRKLCVEPDALESWGPPR